MRRTHRRTTRNRKTVRRRSRDWIVVVPSQKRAETLKSKTLKTLQGYNIEPRRIHVFVANATEAAEQRRVLHPRTYGRLIIGRPGLAEVRNYIFNQYPVGTRMFCLDDDVTGWKMRSSTGKLVPLRNLRMVIERGWRECRRAGARLWGFQPAMNPQFMEDNVTTKLKFIPGGAWGCFNPGTAVTLPLSEKEDYIRSLMFQDLDGSVVRMNWIATNTAVYSGEGGMQAWSGRLRREEAAVRQILEKWPQYAKRAPHRKSPFPEIVLYAPAGDNKTYSR